MEFKPYDYQKYCIDRVIDTPKIGLFLEMGLGKTIITLLAVKELKYMRFAIRKVLIVAPKKVAEGTWQKESKKWDQTQALRISTVLGSKAKRIKALNTPADIYIINRDNISWLVDYYRNDWPFDMVVLDESTSFKNQRSKRFKSLKMILPKLSRLVELTGTPSPNTVEDLWSQVYLLDQGQRLEPFITRFREKYLYPTKTIGSGQVVDRVVKPGGMDIIMQQISDICVSMRSEDYLQLPDLVYHTIPVVLDPKARKSYDTLEEKMVLKLLEEEAEEEITVASAVALSNKLLQLSNGALYDEDHIVHEIHDCKIEALLELIESLHGKPLLVFYSFQHDKDRIMQALAKSKLVVKELKTTQDEDAWNNHEIDILITHPASSCYGLNLQHGGNHVCWFGLTWAYEQYAQANKRLHRNGQTERVIIHHLVCEGTRDEDVMAALDKKENVQNFVMDSLKARIRKVKERKKL